MKNENTIHSIIDVEAFEEQANTVLRPNIKFEGSLTGQERIMIQCEFTGDIVDCNEVCIGEHANIKGNISAKIVYILGHIEGDVVGSQQVSLLEGGMLKGDMIAPMTSKSPESILKGRMDSPV